MEIDVTEFFCAADAYDFFASKTERGQNAGAETWANAMRVGTDAPILTTEEQIEALRSYVRGFGAWSEEEIATWSDAQCNALFIQLVSSEMRYLEHLCGDLLPVDWAKARELAEAGTISGSLYPGDNGRVYFYLGG
jgi:hypothetical protein